MGGRPGDVSPWGGPAVQAGDEVPTCPSPRQKAPAPNRISRPALPHPVPVGGPPPGIAPAPPAHLRLLLRGQQGVEREHVQGQRGVRLLTCRRQRPRASMPRQEPASLPGARACSAGGPCWQPYCRAGLSPRGQHSGQGGRAWVDGGWRDPRLLWPQPDPDQGPPARGRNCSPGEPVRGPLGVPGRQGAGPARHRGPSRHALELDTPPRWPRGQAVSGALETVGDRAAGTPAARGLVLVRSGNPRSQP